MIIRDFNIVGVPIPIEAESPLIIDSDAVLALAITGELLQLIAGRFKSRNSFAAWSCRSLRSAVLAMFLNFRLSPR
jgi:hypothetical protein